MSRPKKLMGLGLVLFVVLHAACADRTPVSEQQADTVKQPAQTEAPNEEVQIDTTPVKLTIFAGWNISDNDYNQIFVQPVTTKYPHISLEMVLQSSGHLPEAIASGSVGDIIVTGNMHVILDLGLAVDLTDFTKEYNFDTNRIEPNILQTIKAFGKQGELFTLPYGLNYNALYYNKTLFDKFATDYPADGLTWEEVIEIGRQVTQKDGDTQYRGLETSNVVRIASPLSLNFFDPVTGKAKLNTDEWKRAYQIFQSILSIPGNEPPNKVREEINAFLYEKTVAMLPTLGLFHRMPEAAAGGLDWDLATYPIYQEKPGTYGEVDAYYMTVTPSSRHQDQAFLAISAILEDEFQTASSKLGMVVTPLKSQQIKDVFGSEADHLKDKNVQAIFKHSPAVIRENWTRHDKMAENLIFKRSLDLYNNKDINTVIRETEEAIDQEVAGLEAQ